MPASGSGGGSRLVSRLRRELRGTVWDDPFHLARYSTDASFYRVQPLAVALPANADDVETAIGVARSCGVPVIPRGAGTSLGGQVLGRGLVVDTTPHLNRLLSVDPERASAVVEPGIVLEQLNRSLRPHGLFFPVDPATASRATIGGMVGNNSAGARSIRYGMTVDNVFEIDVALSDGARLRFGPVSSTDPGGDAPGRYRSLIAGLRLLRAREADELERRLPRVMRHVAGYNLQRVSSGSWNPAQILVGSEGTLGFFTEIELRLQPLPAHRGIGVCHFPDLRSALVAVPRIAALDPSAVELLDSALLELARDHPGFRAPLARFVRGSPQALLLVEFSGAESSLLTRGLAALEQEMAALGHHDAVLAATERHLQEDIWYVRKAGLNILMSMRGDGKPVAFVEDCAVPLEHLADYQEAVSGIFERHGTRGVWYAHASVGCLHVRPILNLRSELETRKVRAIAEEVFDLVRRYRGSHSGEHGDGLVRSEFIEPMLGPRLTRAFGEIKRSFDPEGVFNPGKIVDPPRMDDPDLLRSTGAAALTVETALDWSEWGGLSGAARSCNNNGTCRNQGPGVMCPSYRISRDETHVTRGRANILREALEGRLGHGALTSPGMLEAFDLCVSCKACRSECPMGVDAARMKIEILHRERRERGLTLGERAIAYLPRYAPWVSPLAAVVNALPGLPGARRLVEAFLGVSARRSLPRWSRAPLLANPDATPTNGGPELLLLPDTFTTWFEPEVGRAAVRVLSAAGYRVRLATAPDGRRPLCCGRPFLSMGLVEEARAEGRRLLSALEPWLDRGLPVVGVEPSCLLTLRDELPALIPGPASTRLAARAQLLEERIAEDADRGTLSLPLRPLPGRALLHGHCHQKAFGALPAVETALRLIPELRLETIPSSCCGMAGVFGFEARHFDASLQMGELSLLPTVRAAPRDAWIVADGTSCRHQIRDGSGREALHAAQLLEVALGCTGSGSV